MAAVNTRISPTGTISRRVGRKLMGHSIVTTRLLREAFEDITDGDNDNRRAARILVRLEEYELYRHHLASLRYDGDLSGEEKAADQYLQTDDDKTK